MQRRFKGLVIVGAMIAAAAYFLQSFEIGGLDQLTVRPRSESPFGTASRALPPAARDGQTIRIATFNIQVFGESKMSKPEVMEVLAEVVRRFDIVAIQEIRAKNQMIVPRFVDMINSTGRHYDFVLGPRLGRTSSKEQYAYIYDTASVEVDPESIYTVDDPDDLLHRPPLVAGFRARGPPPEDAFTFTLINIHTDPDEVPEEIRALAAVFRAVRNDGRGEDDIILLGDLNASDRQLGELADIANMAWALSNTPTNTRGTAMYDNILFQASATTEFTGAAGVLDLMSEFNLTLDVAQQVSDHLPVWAEFSVYEGGRVGRFAAGAEAATRQ